MKSKFWIGLIAATSMVATLVPAVSSAAPAAQRPNFERKERHPEIHRAMKALERAELDLRRADRDFGGHRAKAAQLIHEALEECRAALRADRT